MKKINNLLCIFACWIPAYAGTGFSVTIVRLCKFINLLSYVSHSVICCLNVLVLWGLE